MSQSDRLRWQRAAPRAEGAELFDSADWTTATVLHERYLDDVLRYVSRRIPMREEAEDVTSQVFTAAFQTLPRFRGQCHPRVWLLGIARRKIVDAYRRRKVRRETLESELSAADLSQTAASPGAEANDPATVFLRAESQRAVRQVMAELKEEQREALLLQYVEGLTIAEIAAVMGRSPGAANSLLQRARAALLRRGESVFADLEVEL
ncbi:MAG: RNA polymerase sigma factor [Actinomycetota bacterium]